MGVRRLEQIHSLHEQNPRHWSGTPVKGQDATDPASAEIQSGAADGHLSRRPPRAAKTRHAPYLRHCFP